MLRESSTIHISLVVADLVAAIGGGLQPQAIVKRLFDEFI